MRQNNVGIKILLVVLVIVCIFQSGTLISLTEELEVVRYEMSNMQVQIRDLNYAVANLQEEEKSSMEVQWGIEEIDWQNGVYVINYTVAVPSATDDTKVVMSNGIESLELERDNRVYSGKMEYPIDHNNYDTTAYLYEGSYEADSVFVDSLGIENLMAKFLMCEFDGYSSYGNDKLTLAGRVFYQVNLEDIVTAMKLVYGDQEQELSVKDMGEKEIQVSIPVSVDEIEANVPIKALYVEVTTETGIVYKVYPYLAENNNYEIDFDGETEVLYPDQLSWVDVILPDGTIYELNIY